DRFHRTVRVALDDDVQVFHAPGRDVAGDRLQGDCAGGVAGFARFAFGRVAGLFLVGNGVEDVTSLGHGAEAHHLDRVCGAGGGDLAAAVVEHRLDLAPAWAGRDDV